MKLAFTTLGCPDWDLPTIVRRAREYGYDGVDFRGYGQTIPVYTLPEFTTRCEDTVTLFRESGLEVPCFSTSALVAANPGAALAEIAAYAPLCQRFGAKFLRVFGGGEFAETERAQYLERAVSTLRQALPIAEAWDVTLLFETHDAWMDSRHTRRIMESVDSPRVGVLWDVHHPYRYAGESPAETWQRLGPWIRNTHWKDSCLRPGTERGYELCLLGEGDLPLAEIMHTLQAGGYDGYLTLEWEKRWVPELAEPEVAFPHFVAYMQQLLGT